jgi:hypothetical protein
MCVAAGVLALGFLVQRTALAGHESPFYPSFYPQEIRIETLDTAAAAVGWPKVRVHAYVGDDIFAGGSAPADAAPVTSLQSYLVVTFDAVSGPYQATSSDAQTRCAAAGRVLRALTPGGAGYVSHPYPVTPFHADYLEQFDLARRARLQYATDAGGAATGPNLRIRAEGHAARLLPDDWKASAGEWDATLEEIDIGSLVGSVAVGPGAWLGQPWLKQGWFQAYHLYAGRSSGNTAGAGADTAYRRLVTGNYRDLTQRINLERSLVATLVAGCKRVVLGYTLRREYFDSDYSAGVENVAFDSQTGLQSAIFPRTVKLKDFPWNGWLRVGTPARASAAWNPVGGFNDEFGRLLWITMSDPALLPAPYGGSWIANRASIDAKSGFAAVSIPSDAVRPEAGTGLLRRVGSGKVAQQRLRYSVVTSAFHDGTAPGVADVLYPYSFAFRWGVEKSGADGTFDPVVARSTALAREWLAGFKVIGVTTLTRDYGSDLQFSYRVPVVDVYLNYRSTDPWEAAAVAPPWSTLPWHVITLMEEAVRRGIAAFSESEARRRAVPWLDLVRDRATSGRLAALVDEFQAQAYRPDALREMVTADEARERWTALARFYAEHGHFLVTNGPYRLDSWTADGVKLEVFRDLSYPQGVGLFDAYSIPLKAYVSKVEDRGDRIEIRADVEQASKFQRSYEVVRVALGHTAGDDSDLERPLCRYVIVGPAGDVVRAGAGPFATSGRFVLDLKGLGAPGLYTIVAALYVGGNSVDPEVKVIEHRIAGTATAQHALHTERGMPAVSR